METAVSDVARTVELLAVCGGSEAVGQWDEHAVIRAWRWASHCQKLSSQFLDNESVRNLIDKQLRITNQNLCAIFPGHTAVTFADLSRCQQLLVGRLLSNPSLPLSITKFLFVPSSQPQQGVEGLCSQMIQLRSACRTLSSVSDQCGASAGGADAAVQAEMLLDRLDSILRAGGRSGIAQQFLDSVPQLYTGAVEHLCKVLAAALLARTNPQDASVDFLLSWLQRREDLLQHLCATQSAALLTELSKTQEKFRTMYCNMLKWWASDLEYSIDEGEWLQTGSTPATASFQKLTEHYSALLEACPSLREDVEKDLEVLKMNDGDYEVRGLSVWGDLLSEIQR